MDYKEEEGFNNDEKDPLEILRQQSNKESDEVDTEELISVFRENFQKLIQDFSFENLKILANDIDNNSKINYMEYFDSDLIKSIVEMSKNDEISFENANIFLEFVYSLLSLKGTDFSMKLCDANIIEPLTIMLGKFPPLWPNIINDAALLLNVDFCYQENIINAFAGPVLESLNEFEFIEKTHSSLLFVYVLCIYVDLSDQLINDIINSLLASIEHSDYSGFRYIIWSFIFLAKSYSKELMDIGCEKIMSTMLAILNDPPFDDKHKDNIVYSVLEFIDKLIIRLSDPDKVLPMNDIIDMLLNLSNGTSPIVETQSFSVLNTIITRINGTIDILFEKGIIDLICSAMNTAGIHVKKYIFVLFISILDSCNADIALSILQNKEIISIFTFLHESDGLHFISFAKALTKALHKCDEAGSNEAARELLLNEEVPSLIESLKDESMTDIVDIANDLIINIEPSFFDDDGD